MKKINLLALIVLVLILVIVGIILIFVVDFPKNEETQQKIEEFSNHQIDILRISTSEELEEVQENYSLELREYNSSTKGFKGVAISNKKMDIIYSIENDQLYQFNGNFELYNIGDKDRANEETLMELQNVISNVNFLFGEVVGTNIDSFGIYDAEGFPLSIDETESYVKILSGTASYALKIRDNDGSFWNISSYLSDDAILFIDFFHSFDKELYKDVSCDVIVE